MTERVSRQAARWLSIIRHAEEVTGSVAKLAVTSESPGIRTTAGSGATSSSAWTDSAIAPAGHLSVPIARQRLVAGQGGQLSGICF